MKSILDIGCGTGELVRKIKALSGSWFNVNGIDLSEKMIMYAKRHSDKEISFYTGDIENLKFKDETFDIITAIGVFEYLDEDDKALKEVHRVLKRGGMAIIELRNESFSLFSMNKYTLNFFLKRLDLPELKIEDGYNFKRRQHNISDFKKKAEDMGFEVGNIKFYHFHILPPIFKFLSFYENYSKKLESNRWNFLGRLMASAFLIGLYKR